MQFKIDIGQAEDETKVSIEQLKKRLIWIGSGLAC